MLTYAIWNNKGGVGKTSLTFQAVCRYAENNPDKRILAIDMCPQANLSELFLGGSEQDGRERLFHRQNATPRCSIGGYFDVRILSAYQVPEFNATDFITQLHLYSPHIPKTIDLVCGDQLLELQAIAMNSLANLRLPGVNTWLTVIDWLRDFLAQINDRYDLVFIDTNPSFSIYTQIVLAAADRIVLPILADYTARHVVQNVLSLIYGIKLPSKVYESYAFVNQMKQVYRSPPKIHLILKNRMIQRKDIKSTYMDPLPNVDSTLKNLIKSYPEYLTFKKVSDGVVDICDFGITGLRAFARSVPFSKMPDGEWLKSACRDPSVPFVPLDCLLANMDNFVKKL